MPKIPSLSTLLLKSLSTILIVTGRALISTLQTSIKDILGCIAWSQMSNKLKNFALMFFVTGSSLTVVNASTWLRSLSSTKNLIPHSRRFIWPVNATGIYSSPYLSRATLFLNVFRVRNLGSRVEIVTANPEV